MQFLRSKLGHNNINIKNINNKKQLDFESRTKWMFCVGNNLFHAYVMFSVPKLDTIEFIKFSRMITARIDFQSVAFSPSSRQIDSSANLTTDGGLAMVRTSTSCCLRIDLTAAHRRWIGWSVGIG